MNRRESLVMLVVLGLGVFLAGLDLMITAVALPSIVADLGGWTELRHASWIVNGYLLAYVATMPLAGRLADLWGARRLFGAALVAFTVGSLLAGMAQSLDQLIAARLVQAVGGGAIVPVATAAAAHLYEGHARPRAVGAIGALTFLGMAAGPFVGAALLGSIHAESALEAAGVSGGPLPALLAPAWRWVFYINVPIGVVAMAIAWAAGVGWDTPRRKSRVDLLGAVAFTTALGAGLLAVTLIGSGGSVAGLGVPVGALAGLLAVIALVAMGLTIVLGVRGREPFLDVRLFADREFASATLISLLTGYALATAIVGAAVFVDRVLYGGPGEQQVALGALAAATAVGALVSGIVVRWLSLRLVTMAGLALGVGGLLAMARWTPATSIESAALALAAFGLGFGLTVTPRSTAALEVAGRAAFGMASSTVTVARMVGMAIGLAVLTAYGSTTIEHLSNQVYATPDAWQAFVPIALRSRSLHDGLVVDALERWASTEAAAIMVGLFLVAAVVVAVAVLPALVIGRRRSRMLAGGPGHGEDMHGDDSGDRSLEQEAGRSESGPAIVR